MLRPFRPWYAMSWFANEKKGHTPSQIKKVHSKNENILTQGWKSFRPSLQCRQESVDSKYLANKNYKNKES